MLSANICIGIEFYCGDDPKRGKATILFAVNVVEIKQYLGAKVALTCKAGYYWKVAGHVEIVESVCEINAQWKIGDDDECICDRCMSF